MNASTAVIKPQVTLKNHNKAASVIKYVTIKDTNDPNSMPYLYFFISHVQRTMTAKSTQHQMTFSIKYVSNGIYIKIHSQSCAKSYIYSTYADQF